MRIFTERHQIIEVLPCVGAIIDKPDRLKCLRSFNFELGD